VEKASAFEYGVFLLSVFFYLSAVFTIAFIQYCGQSHPVILKISRKKQMEYCISSKKVFCSRENNENTKITLIKIDNQV